MHARAAKAQLVNAGADNWIDHYDPTLGPAEQAAEVESKKQQAAEQGLPGPGETGEINDDEQLADYSSQERALNQVERRAADAVRNQVDGWEDAARQLQDEFGYSESDIEELKS